MNAKNYFPLQISLETRNYNFNLKILKIKKKYLKKLVAKQLHRE